jgi:transglutaminase-like putative cysteine protease
VVSASDRGLRIALALCVGLGWLSAGIGLFHLMQEPTGWPLLVGCVLWLIFAPLVTDHLRAALERRGLLPRAVARLLALALQLAPLPLLPPDGPLALVLGAAIVAQSQLFLAARQDAAAVACLALPPVIDVLVLTAVPSVDALVLLPLTLLAGVCALLLLHGRMALGDLRREAPDPAPESSFERIAYVLPLGLLLATLSGGGYVLGERVARAFAPSDEAAQNRRPHQPSARGADPDAARGAAHGGAPAEFGQDLSLSGGSFPFGEAIVMEIEPLTELDTGRPLHMRSMVLDRFDENGASLADTSVPPLLSARGGWIRVAEDPPPEHLSRLHVQLRPLRLENRPWTAAFAPHPLTAIALPEVLYHPDQVLVVPQVITRLFVYEVEFERRPLDRRQLATLSARHPAARFTALPADSAALARVRRTAAEWTAGARSDVEKVLRIVRRLELDFTYERTDLGFEGTEAVAAFLEAKRGYCTHFATTAALMLRSEGIPARLATGFLAHEWSEELGRFLVRERNAHAWVEVHFDELGWLTVDPTPSEVGGGAFSRDLGGALDEAQTALFEGLFDTLARWRASEASLGDVLTAVTAGLVQGLRRNPLVLLLVSGGLLALLSVMLGRRAPREPALTRAALPDASPLFARLWTALARHGHARPPAQTQREFGGAVHARGGPDFAPLPGLIDLYYRASYGGRALAEGEELRVEAFLVALEARGEVPREG